MSRAVRLVIHRTSTPPQPAPLAVVAPEPERPLTQVEAAEWLKINRTELSRLTKAGLVPHGRVGQSPRYLRSQLLAWLEGQAA